MLTGAQAMAKALEAEGVKIVYGYPGAAICPFIDALRDSPIRQVLVRQEQNAGHAASGYARITGRPGVCFATSGPGATNLITALATAYMDSIPLIAITGQVRSDLIGRDVFQEADITGAAEPFIKHSYLVKDAGDLPRIFKEAFTIASTGRPGPVLIDVPVDIQGQKLAFLYPDSVDIKGYKPSFKGHALQIRRVAQALSKAKRPVICAGGGVLAAGASKELAAFAEKCRTPVVTTMMGIGALPTDHPLHLGMLGTHGSQAANKAIHESDMVIIVGARVGDRAMAAPNQIASRAQVVHIDVDPAEIGKNMETEIPIVGDARQILLALTEEAAAGDTREWLAAIEGYKSRHESEPLLRDGFIEPRAFIRFLSQRMQDDSVLISDVGQNQIWCAKNVNIRSGRFMTSGGMGTMGYSLPAAIGVKTAAPGRQVVSVSGDGAFQMSMMELATVVEQKLPLKLIIMRNHTLGMVHELQTRLYHGRYTLTDLAGAPDFIALAAAFGIPGRHLDQNSDAPDAIDEMLKAEGPYLLECAVSPDESSL